MSSAPMVPVDLVVNCFERTYRDVLSPGHIRRIEKDNVVRFEQRTVLINNVDDRAEAEALARARQDDGEIDRWIFVADELDEALRRTGLVREDLGSIPYFTDWALVGVTTSGPNFVLLWDADVRLQEPSDWISPALELMHRDPRVLIANPNWEFPNIDDFTFEKDGDFHLGHGASDQVLLGRRCELGRPIYSDRTLALRRYPVSHLGDIFEARIDSHLRRSGRLRASYALAVYLHGAEMGMSYPKQAWRLKLAQERDRMIIRVLHWLPWRPRHLRQL